MKSLLVWFLLALSFSAQAMTDIQSLPMNLSSEFKGDVVIFKSDVGVNSLSLGAVDISVIPSDRNSEMEQYLIKGPMITNPYLKSLMADSKSGTRQRLFFGVGGSQAVDSVAMGVADAVCMQMSSSKDFSAVDFKMAKVDLAKEARSRISFAENTYLNNIYFTFDVKGVPQANHLEKTIQVKMFKDLRGEELYSFTHITCGRK